MAIYPVYAFLYLISLLPWWCIYRISDAVYILLFHVIQYRRRVVRTNLTHAFPELDEIQLVEIEKKYYRYLADLLMESVKMISVSYKSLEKRCSFDNLNLYDEAFQKDQDLILVLGHYGNWELIGQVFQRKIPHKFYVLFRKMKNKSAERLITAQRKRFGANVIEANTVLRAWAKPDEKATATAFIADQSPPQKGSLKLQFMGKETLVYNGVGTLAVRYKRPVVFIKIDRKKRGYYHLCSEMVFDGSEQISSDEITRRHVAMLEKQIRTRPELWLWSHRRWKHQIKY